MTRTTAWTGGLGLAVAMAGAAGAQGISDDKVTIGAMVDMTGVYSANGGEGAVIAAQMAVEDYGGTVAGASIEVISANYQNRVDVASNVAREWIDQQNADMIIESTDSASAIAIQNIGEEKGVLTIAAGSASTALTNDECSPLGIHYVYDTYALATGTGNAIVQEGLTDWFFITADYAFGHSLEENTAKVVKDLGGTVVGTVRHPFGGSDFSSFILQAQSSGAQVVAFANAGTDFSTAVKQASEFGVVESGQTIARDAGVPHRHRRARLRRGPGPDLHDGLLLELQRRDAGVRGPLLRASRQDADDDPRGLLLGDHPLP